MSVVDEDSMLVLVEDSVVDSVVEVEDSVVDSVVDVEDSVVVEGIEVEDSVVDVEVEVDVEVDVEVEVEVGSSVVVVGGSSVVVSSSVVVVPSSVVVVVGSGVGSKVWGSEDGSSTSPTGTAAESSSPFPAGKVTRIALLPLGAVTTQKLAPPAPFVEEPPSPLTSLTASVAGSIIQGRPLHCFPSSQTILIPQSGRSFLNGVVGSR